MSLQDGMAAFDVSAASASAPTSGDGARVVWRVVARWRSAQARTNCVAPQRN